MTILMIFINLSTASPISKNNKQITGNAKCILNSPIGKILVEKADESISEKSLRKMNPKKNDSFLTPEHLAVEAKGNLLK